MRRAIISASLGLALVACASIDTKVENINAQVARYCDFLVFASSSASMISDKKILRDVDNGISTYCNPANEIKDVPSALVSLAKIYKAIVDGHKSPAISLAAG